MQLFYAPDISENTNYALSEEESKHCVRVLRKKTGDFIHLIDGVGGMYKCEIIQDFPKQCIVSVIETVTNFEKRNYTLHLAVAPTKSIDRFEWFLEKATEIGIDAITPLECEHSERKIIKTERSEKVILSAVKQSLKAYYPKFDELTKFKTFINSDFKGKDLYIAHCEPSEHKKPLKELLTKGNDSVILIGPEGDFSTEEIELAKNKGFKEISLGESRLRTETAGVVAVSIASFVNS
ncbi:MAG: 16S rRNA (uracil(1498)-N(3))-methyltransferase [Rikenellaceae bacterium]